MGALGKDHFVSDMSQNPRFVFFLGPGNIGLFCRFFPLVWGVRSSFGRRFPLPEVLGEVLAKAAATNNGMLGQAPLEELPPLSHGQHRWGEMARGRWQLAAKLKIWKRKPEPAAPRCRCHAWLQRVFEGNRTNWFCLG